MFTFKALNILIYLIPGFISASILNVLLERKEKSELGKIVEALIFSMFIYTIFSIVFNRSPITLNQIEESITYSYDAKSFLWLGAFSIGIPVLLSFLIINEWHMKLGRLLRISRGATTSSVWCDAFRDLQRHVIINFADGRRLYGWPTFYSKDPDKPYLFLFKPAWVEEDKENQERKYVELGIEGILLTPEQKIESIEFLKS